MLNVLLTLVSLVWITSCAPPQAAREQPMSTTFSEDGSGLYKIQGRIISWGARATNIPFAFDPDFPPELRAGCTSAAKTWNDVVGHELIKMVEHDAPYSDGSDGQNVISFGKSKREFAANHAAETVIHIARMNPRIIEADVDFDTRHFKFGLGGVGNEADVESTCLHELGHALGLTHIMNRQSIMNPRLTLGVPKRQPSTEDQTRIQSLYPAQ